MQEIKIQITDYIKANLLDGYLEFNINNLNIKGKESDISEALTSALSWYVVNGFAVSNLNEKVIIAKIS
jgi:hypothetical protein